VGNAARMGEMRIHILEDWDLGIGGRIILKWILNK
jgi:hypothetical protein